MPRGISLWELSLAFVLTAVLAAGIAWPAVKMGQTARVRRTLLDMSSLLAAGCQYDAIHGAWPSSWKDIREMLPRMPEANDWGRPYVLASDARRLWIETEIPSGHQLFLSGADYCLIRKGGAYDRVRVSAGRSYGQAARLVYGKKNALAR
ncbi:MAG: hypothetical protein WCI27_09410 [Candidatus Omnitrophota bacterium]